MKRFATMVIVLLAIAACSGKKQGSWPQGHRDELVSACVESTKQNPSLDGSKIKDYCSCYQKKLEDKVPVFEDMAKMSEDDMTKVAQECLPLVMK